MPLQYRLPLTSVRNRDLFSSHWLEKRLPLEPEWKSLRDDAHRVLVSLGSLWQVQKNRVEKYGNEQGLEEGFILPVLHALGWKLKYQTLLQGREPDYALFVDDVSLDAALNAGRNSPDFWKYVAIVADAKAWNTSLDRPSIVNNQREYPPQQIEWYLDRSGVDFGILTNGKLWRLSPRVPLPHQRRFQTFLEFDLHQLLHDWTSHPSLTEQLHLIDEFLYFYLLFSPIAHIEVPQRQPLIKRAIQGSSEYRIGVSKGLKGRAFKALRFCIEGFLDVPENELDSGRDLQLIREQSFILLYRLLFIMYAEDRRLLPYGINRSYTNNRSLRRHRDEIAAHLDRMNEGRDSDYSRETTHIWGDLLDLFDLVNGGRRIYGVPAYNGGLFDPETHPFLASKKINDNYMSRVIDMLGRARDPEHPASGLFRVDYHDLAIQHLGAVYEGLLELQPHQAIENMLVIYRRTSAGIEEKIIASSAPVPKGFRATEERIDEGTIYLATEKGERRATGSYYTPDHIVRYIVENTLGPLCSDVGRKLQSEINGLEQSLEGAKEEEKDALLNRLQILRQDFDNRILNMRVLDPAMGSGHFLLRACQYLAEEIATHPYTHEPAGDESSLTYWKRLVVERCLYGVDLNPLAVELAKLALWLETVAADRPLTFLDHHLRCGNSIIGGKISTLGVLPGAGGLIKETFARQAQDALHVLLEPLAAIRQVDSDTPEHVKQKERLHKVFEKRREPFRAIADLWCSVACQPESDVTAEMYQSLVERITQPNVFKKLLSEDWVQVARNFAARPDVKCFTWELEFPEAFRYDDVASETSGFDAVIGNPPYDVLEKERKKAISFHTVLTEFVKTETDYDAAMGGKLNLFRFFLVQSLLKTREGGRLGMIVPLALLADISCAGTRRELLRYTTEFMADCFPQKDDANRRVFRDAKLSTVVITGTKKLADDSSDIRVRVFPADNFDDEFRQSVLKLRDVLMVDPKNISIPLVDDREWALCTRIHSDPKITLLRRVADYKVTRGEINQTIYREFISSDPSQSRLLKGVEVGRYAIREKLSQGRREWFNEAEFLNSHNPRAVVKERRIATQRITGIDEKLRIVATIVNPPTYFADSTNSIVINKRSKYCLEYLLGLLNSRLFQWRFRLTSTNNNVGTNEIESLPFRTIDFKNRGDAELYDGIVRNVEQMLSTQDQLRLARTSAEYDSYSQHAEALDNTLDQLVNRLYGINQDELKLIELRTWANKQLPAQPLEE